MSVCLSETASERPKTASPRLNETFKWAKGGYLGAQRGYLGAQGGYLGAQAGHSGA